MIAGKLRMVASNNCGRVKVMEYLRVSDYAVRIGRSERTVRDWVKKGKVDYTYKMIDGKKIQVIEVKTVSNISPNVAAIDAEYEEIASNDIAEHEEVAGNSIISMENTTFDNLIDKITKLADDSKITDQKTIDFLYAEVHELRAATKAQQEEIKQHIRDTALLEVELNIKKVELEEKDKKITELEAQLDHNVSVWFKKL